MLGLHQWLQSNQKAREMCYVTLTNLSRWFCFLCVFACVCQWRHSLVDVDMSWNSLDEAALSEAVLNLCDAGEFPRLQSVDLSGTGISIAALK